MAENREYQEDKREYPTGSTYSSQDRWSGGYGNPYTMSWQGSRGYGQREVYGSVYDRSSTSHGHSEFTADLTDNSSSLYHFGQHGPSTFPVDTSQVPYYHHMHVPRDTAGPYGVGHPHSAHMPPATHSDLSAPQELLNKSGRESTTVVVDVSTTSDSSSRTDYAGSFLAQVQKSVARHREAFDLLVEGHRGCEEEIHHNVHSGEMCEL